MGGRIEVNSAGELSMQNFFHELRLTSDVTNWAGC